MPIPREFLEKLSVNPNYTRVLFPISKFISMRRNESTLDESSSPNGDIFESSYRNFNDPPNSCKSINKEKNRIKDSDGYQFNVYTYYI